MNCATIINGDARRIPLADRSVHCVVTSPPYFGLRDYGTARWEGGDDGCDHQIPAAILGGGNNKGHGGSFTANYRDACRKCGARRVDRQIGLEPTPDDFTAAMVAVFREVRRVLRDDGMLWLNIGDSYTSGGRSSHGNIEATKQKTNAHAAIVPRPGLTGGLKPKDLIGIPWRVALALQADGWYLRSDIIWHKPNPMPESVTDRPTKSHEYVFLLTKQERYFYDVEAVREKWADKRNGASGDRRMAYQVALGRRIEDSTLADGPRTSDRNLRSVWSIPTEAYAGAHFATFPRKLVIPCIKAGTSARGVCPACGAPHERVVEREATNHISRVDRQIATGGAINGGVGKNFPDVKLITKGWRPTCLCDAGPPVPATVLDPFCGSGTTGVVATGLGRRFVGVELNPEYCRMAARRISRPHASHRTDRGVPLPLFAGIEA